MRDMTINNFDDINLRTTVSLRSTVILWDLRQNNSLATLNNNINVDDDHITTVLASLDDNSHSMIFTFSRPEKDNTNAGWYYNTIFCWLVPIVSLLSSRSSRTWHQDNCRYPMTTDAQMPPEVALR